MLAECCCLLCIVVDRTWQFLHTTSCSSNAALLLIWDESLTHCSWRSRLSDILKNRSIYTEKSKFEISLGRTLAEKKEVPQRSKYSYTVYTRAARTRECYLRTTCTALPPMTFTSGVLIRSGERLEIAFLAISDECPRGRQHGRQGKRRHPFAKTYVGRIIVDDFRTKHYRLFRHDLRRGWVGVKYYTGNQKHYYCLTTGPICPAQHQVCCWILAKRHHQHVHTSAWSHWDSRDPTCVFCSQLRIHAGLRRLRGHAPNAELSQSDKYPLDVFVSTLTLAARWQTAVLFLLPYPYTPSNCYKVKKKDLAWCALAMHSAFF